MLTIETNISKNLTKALDIDGVEFRYVLDNICDHLYLHIKPVEAGKYVCKNKTEIINAPWVTSWWARLIKWLLKKKYLSKLVPYPLQCLANACSLTSTLEVSELNDTLLNKIYTQIVALRMKGKRPYCIIIGFDDWFNLNETLGPTLIFENYSMKNNESRFKINGLPCHINQFVNGIIVIPEC